MLPLAVYNGALTDFNVVNQFVNNGPVKFLQVQIFADDRRPFVDGGGLPLYLVHLGQKRVQAFRLGKPLLFVFLRQHRESVMPGAVLEFALMK